MIAWAFLGSVQRKQNVPREDELFENHLTSKNTYFGIHHSVQFLVVSPLPGMGRPMELRLQA